MSSIADWKRPSTLLFAGILAVNLALPLMHFWPQDAGADEGPVIPPRSSADGDTADSHPAGTPPGVAPAVAIEPIPMALPAKRPMPEPQVESCWAWGPFAEQAEAESLADELRLEPGTFDVRAFEVPGRPDYLVKVQAPGSRQAVAELMARLKSREVDSYVLDRQEQGSVLAAGVFRNPARAEIQRRTVADLGYEAVVEILDRSTQMYHLVAHMPADLEPLVPAAGVCSDIAPPERFL